MGDTQSARSPRRAGRRAVPAFHAALVALAIGALAGVYAYGLVVAGPQPSQSPSNICLCGTAFAWGPASNVTSNTSPSAGCAPHIECYDLEIGSAGSGLSGNGMIFSIVTSQGYFVPTYGWTFTLVDISGDATSAVWSGPARCMGQACPMTLQSGEVIAISTGATRSLVGDNVIGIGTGTGGGFQGEISTVGGLPA
jgi:hypothetical protein